MKNKVIVLGSIAYDYIMSFEENFVNAVSMDREKEEYQSTVTAADKIQRYGGTAGNIAYNLGLLNIARTSVFGSVGNDFESLGYREHVSKFDKIVFDVDVFKDLYTAACYIVNDIKANQMIVFHGGALNKCEEIDLKDKISDPESYAYAINSTQSIKAMENFANQLYDLGIPSIFDPGQVTVLFPKNILIEIIKKSKILIGNKYEISQIKEKTGLSDEELMQLVNAVITTKGADGSLLIYKDDSGKIHNIDIPISKPEIVEDNTGAGDGYRAGVLSGLLLNMTLIDSCRLGSIVGSFVIETHGAQTHFYDIINIRKRFFDTFGYVPQELEQI
ncbi:MAG: hypothetical protein KGD73_04155 [Candidatus Lokiarchaeota archaeon]|nr:hypothetical protein [Candidatus Lokiarchaeota archaeon]